MRRREFVRGAVALPGVLPFLRSTAQMRRMHVGCAAITWGGNDAAAIDEISALGYRGIQLRASAVERWGSRPGELADQLGRRGLTFVALSSGLVRLDPAHEADDLALHLKHARFLRDAGGLYLQVVDERPNGRQPTTDDYTRMGRLLGELGKRVTDLGVTLGYHNHMGNLGQAPEEVSRVLLAANPRHVRLELDIAHYHAAGGDPVDAVWRYADRLLFLHLKDVRRPASGGAAGSYEFVELGEGEVNVAGVVDALSRTSFNGWAIVELDRVTVPGRTPRESNGRSKAFLASHGVMP